MKRSAGSEFDESGAKWFPSPYYKEVKTDINGEEGSKMKDPSKRFTTDYDKESRLKKERFYDLFARVNKEGEFRLDIDELTKTLNIRAEDIPDTYKISTVFEELNSKSAVIARGKKNWSEQETFLCIWIVVAFSTLNHCDYNDLTDKEWESIGRIFPSKSTDQCKTRWQGLLKMNLTKAPWNQEEDKMLIQIIQDKGPKKWKEIAFELNKKMDSSKVFRQGKQCRERWINHLDPAINRGAWTNEEDIKLLESHLSIGKKWAEIAKNLRSRTENAVKNRWNSLIKKYRAEYGIDFDTLSTSSAYSNKSMEDLERKIAEMLITNKKKSKDECSPDTIGNGQIMEIPEEESPGYYSDFSIDTGNIKNENGHKGYVKKEDDGDKSDAKSQNNKKKKKPVTSVSVAKNNLRDMVHKEIQNHPNPNFQTQPNSSEHTPLTPTESYLEDASSLQQIFMFGGNPDPSSIDFRQDQNVPQPEPMNQPPMPLMNQYPKEARSNLYNMTSDMLNYNIWRNNLSNMNVFPQSPQQPNLHPNLFNIYNQGNMFQQSNYNLAPAGLPATDTFQTKCSSSQSLPTPTEADKKLIKLNETKFITEENNGRLFNLVEKPITQFIPPEVPQNNLYYAVVDLSGGQMYLLDSISKDNYPPTFNQTKMKPATMGNPSLNNSMDIIHNSPGMGHAAWASPNLNPNLVNYPLFNSSFPTMNFAKAQFSPNINLFHESPKLNHNIFNTTPLMEGRSTEWTPDGMSRSFFTGLSMKQRIGLANSRGETPPAEIGGMNGGAFVRRMNDRSKTGSGISTDGLKYNSPSSFLQTSQTNHTRSKIAALESKIKN